MNMLTSCVLVLFAAIQLAGKCDAYCGDKCSGSSKPYCCETLGRSFCAYDFSECAQRRPVPTKKTFSSNQPFPLPVIIVASLSAFVILLGVLSVCWCVCKKQPLENYGSFMNGRAATYNESGAETGQVKSVPITEPPPSYEHVTNNRLAFVCRDSHADGSPPAYTTVHHTDNESDTVFVEGV
uniref:uncharacterized protein LOC104265924 n=1 Tax=Ciona intestinalis TaxID=7719 RepID=UPI00006A5B80|nr:uncharacterized protein LOC104265924 [Ciona intestinalis]|eukprot:XP_009859387.1 uncharacterized protein LOC104265924 [Ciona intestinalis]